MGYTGDTIFFLVFLRLEFRVVDFNGVLKSTADVGLRNLRSAIVTDGLVSILAYWLKMACKT